MKTPVSFKRLDLSDIRKRLGNDEALIADLLQLFLDTCPEQLAAIKNAVGVGSADAVRRAAHTLKGAAGNMSATGIAARAADLETAAERGETAGFQRLLADLEEEVALLLAELGDTSARSL